jgi:hypothetical protein
VRRVGHWPAARWAVATHGTATRSRGDVVFELVQRLADIEADACGRERRAVPRLDSDAAITDQLRVMVADLADCPGAPLVAAIEWIESTLRDL